MMGSPQPSGAPLPYQVELLFYLLKLYWFNSRFIWVMVSEIEKVHMQILFFERSWREIEHWIRCYNKWWPSRIVIQYYHEGIERITYKWLFTNFSSILLWVEHVYFLPVCGCHLGYCIGYIFFVSAWVSFWLIQERVLYLFQEGFLFFASILGL
jgi:hypothetical protein